MLTSWGYTARLLVVATVAAALVMAVLWLSPLEVTVDPVRPAPSSTE